MCSVLGRLIAHVLKIHSIDNELYLSNKKKTKQTSKKQILIIDLPSLGCWIDLLPIKKSQEDIVPKKG